MFCPKCRSEFRAGLNRCPDCRVALSAELPAEPEPGFVAYAEVLTTFNTADIAFLKSLLDAEGVGYYFQGENFSRIDPMIQPARLMVRVAEVEKVRVLLADTGIAFAAINLPESG